LAIESSLDLLKKYSLNEVEALYIVKNLYRDNGSGQFTIVNEGLRAITEYTLTYMQKAKEN
jgi:hypothetical protein